MTFVGHGVPRVRKEDVQRALKSGETFGPDDRPDA